MPGCASSIPDEQTKRIVDTKDLSDGLYRVLQEAKCPEPFFQWCQEVGWFTTSDIAIRCKDEDGIDKE